MTSTDKPVRLLRGEQAYLQAQPINLLLLARVRVTTSPAQCTVHQSHMPKAKALFTRGNHTIRAQVEP